MIIEVLHTILWSISPFGEARVGIPYGVHHGVPVVEAFLFGWAANLFVFPLFYKVINLSNKYLWHFIWYKKSAIYLSKRAKSKTKSSIDKYGAWGLMVFVMIPLPITGAYMGTLAAYVLGMNYKTALFATTVGVTISSMLIAVGAYGFTQF